MQRYQRVEDQRNGRYLYRMVSFKGEYTVDGRVLGYRRDWSRFTVQLDIFFKND